MDRFATSLLMGLISEFLNRLLFGAVGILISSKGQDCDTKSEFASKLVGFAGSLDLLHVANGRI